MIEGERLMEAIRARGMRCESYRVSLLIEPAENSIERFCICLTDEGEYDVYEGTIQHEPHHRKYKCIPLDQSVDAIAEEIVAEMQAVEESELARARRTA